MGKPFTVHRNDDEAAIEAAREQHEVDHIMYKALAGACYMLGKTEKGRMYQDKSEFHEKRWRPLQRDALKVIPGKRED